MTASLTRQPSNRSSRGFTLVEVLAVLAIVMIMVTILIPVIGRMRRTAAATKATAQIIRSREQTKRVPIVFLSAVNKESQHLLRGYSMGAVDYVFKPVDPVVLQSKVAVFVDLFTMTREIQRKARQEQALLDANLRANAERLRIEQELRLAEQRFEARKPPEGSAQQRVAFGAFPERNQGQQSRSRGLEVAARVPT